MAMGKSFNKSILFVLGIVLVVSAFSGCTDVDSPTTLHDEKTLQALLDEDASMTEIHETLKPFADSNGYKLDISRVPETNLIASIGVISDDDTNYLRFLNTDRNPDVDEIITKDKTLYPAPADDDADTKIYGKVIDLYSDKDSVSFDNKGGYFFEGGFDLNQLKNVEKIRLHTGDHEFVYKLIHKGVYDTGAIKSLWFENANPAEDEKLRNSRLGIQDLNRDGIIDKLKIPADFNGDGELDTLMTLLPGGGPKGDHNEWDILKNRI